MTDRILEIRTYRLRTGTTDAFHRVFVDQAGPLLREFGLDVVRGAPSERNEDGEESYVLIRAFDSIEQRDELEAKFYGSDAWKTGPQQPVVSKVESYHTVLLTVPDVVIEGLRV